MQNAVIIQGRLTSPTSLELDEPVHDVTGKVQVILSAAPGAQSNESVFEFLQKLPPGTRTKEDIDRQIRDERDSWEGRN